MSKKRPPPALPGDALVNDLLRPEVEESLQLDFKRVGKNDTALETVCAFANTEGGVLVLGVEDPKKATGRDRVFGVQENPEAVDDLRRLIPSRIQPPLDPAPELEEVRCTLRDGTPGSIVLVRVQKSGRVHAVVDKAPFLRLPKSNRRLWSAEEIAALSLRRGSTPFDAGLVDVPVELLETATWHQYAAQRRLTRPLADALLHTGLARRDDDGKIKPTRAAVLLFAEEPNGLLASKCTIRLFHYKGTAPERTPSTNLVRPPRTIGGPLIAQIRGALRACLDELASGVQVSPLGFEVVQRYPVRVLQEAITNAVLHRAYLTPPAVVDDLVLRLQVAEPEAVIIAGDLGHPSGDFGACLTAFRRLSAPVAVLAGNHDVWRDEDHGWSSRDLWEHRLPSLVEEAGFVWLEDAVLRLGEVAVVGSPAWYDYSAGPAHLQFPPEYFASMKKNLNNDAAWIDWPWTDVELSSVLHDGLVRRLEELEADAEVSEVVVVTHVPLFEAQIVRKPGDRRWEISNAYFGNLTTGQAVLRFQKVTRVFSGHTHCARRGLVGRADGPDVEVSTVGSDYGSPELEVIEVGSH